jgi:PAS domain S-box-containing protein
MPPKPLAVLIIEDSESDAALVLRTLEKAGYGLQSERVETETELRTALAARKWDVIIADFRLPRFNAEAALRIVQSLEPDLPFIIVSGSIGEDIAVVMMQAGAHDYIMKGNLTRLAPAVERELEQAQTRRARRDADQALRESEKRYRLLAENVQDVIWILDLDTRRFVYVSPSVQRLRGYTPEEVIGQDFTSSLAPESNQRLAELLPQRIAEFRAGKHMMHLDEVEQPCRDGTSVWTEVTTYYQVSKEDGHLYVYGVSRDITQRRVMERRVRESEEQFRLLVDQSPYAITVIQGNNVVFINKTALTLMHAKSPADLVGHPIADFIHPDGLATTLERIQRMWKGEPNLYPVQDRYVRCDGVTIPVEVIAAPFTYQGRPAIQVLVQDTTERNRAEEALQASEERYRLLAENMSDTVWLMDMNLKILYISPSVVRQRGFTLEELNQLRLDQQMAAESLQRSLQLMSEVLSPENLAKREPGSARRIDIEFYRKDGTTFWAECAFTLILNKEGVPTGILGAAREITERRRAEAVTQRQLRQFAALRNIDNAIRGSLDLRLTLSIILREAVAQLGVDAARILILHSQTKVLEFAAGTGFRTSALQRAELRLGQGFAGQAALDQRTIHVPDLRIRKTDFLQLDNFAAEQFVTYCAVPLVTKGQVIGVMEVFSRSFTPLEERMGDWEEFMQTIADQAAIAVENTHLFMSLQQTNLDLTRSVDDVLDAWAHALDVREKESPGHTRRVAEEAVRLAKMQGMSDTELLGLRRGALLHDIGKMVIPDSILLKVDPLTPDELKILQRHPVYAYELLSASPALRSVLDIPYCHHEKWDGSGYPRGLQGERIPLPARIFAVVDAWDSMVGDRPDRTILSREAALARLRNQSEVDFDPKIVAEYIQALKTERSL